MYNAKNHDTLLLKQKQSTNLNKWGNNNLLMAKVKEITRLYKFYVIH